jgi:glycosyltransferase involved in cell wall biosynthesis
VRFVFVNSSRIWGGNEKWTCEASSGLKKRGHDVVLIGGSDLMEERAASYGVPFDRLRLRGDGDIIGVLGLRGRFKRFAPDAVILTKSKEYWLGGIAAKLAGVGRICYRLGIDRPVQRNIKYRLTYGRICDTFIVNANSVRDKLLEATFITADRIAVIRNGVAVGDTEPQVPPGFLSSLGVPDGATVIGAMGRLAKQKGFDVLLEAFAAVRNEFPETFLVIAGDGYERSDLEGRVQRLGLSGSVSLPGFVQEKDAFYSSITLFALPSRFEGMPNVLLEAMAAGLPTVSSNVSGVGELVQHGVTGCLVPAEDSALLAKSISGLLRDKESMEEMGARARETVRSEFSIDRMVDSLERLLSG